MYNDFARPAEMYDVCLEMLHFSRYDDPEGAVARELWERYLAKSATRASTRRGALDSACAAAARLGRELFPSDAAFPTSHVALHLELMAAGQWGLPEGLTRGEGGEDLDATGEASVASAVLRACRDDAAGAFAAYDRLLAPPGAAGAGLRGEARAERERRLQTPALRLRLLASAAAIVRRWDPSAEERSAREERERERPDGDHRGDPRNAFDTFGGSRDASVRAALADACAAYAGEARRLLQVPASAQGAAEALAAEFDRLAKGFA
jgi:nuclear pore complex protein Nup155